MANIVNGRYALADPSSGLTMLSLEGGEFNMFGSYTRIRTTHKESYLVIDDESTELAVKNNVIGQLITGLAIVAVLAGVAIAVVVTGSAALASLACALGGAAIGVGAVAIGTAINDSETGYNRSWGEYWGGLITGGCIGFMAGASVYGIIAAVPAAATAAGVQASMMLGTSTFTAIVVPNIMTIGGYSLAAASGLYAANDIYSNSRGYNVVLDKIFDNNIEAYETAGMVLDMFGEAYTSLGESNQALGNKSNNASEEQGVESSKKFVNSGDKDNVGAESIKDSNIKNTVNTEIGVAEDNSIKNPVKSDDIAIETTQGNSTKSIVNNKGAESADGDIPHIEIKDKNSKQGVPETDAQGDKKIQYCSNRRKKSGNSENDELSMKTKKSEKDNLDNNVEKGNSDRGKSFANEGIYIEDGNALGELIGKGGNKEVYLFGDDKVIAIIQEGKPLAAIDKEIGMLRQLDELGLPVINAEKIVVDGKPGILMDRCAQDSKSIVALDKAKGKVMLKPNADTSLLNQNSIDDLTKIKQIMNNNKIKINDLQFLIKEDGHIVIADPLDVVVGQLPSKNNNKMLDILIEEAKKNR